VDTILRSFQTTYLDLLLIHFPTAGNIDYLETWRAFEDAVRARKLRSIGLSNFNEQQITRVLNAATIRPQVLQIPMNPYYPQNALLDFCKRNNIVVTAYSPVARSYNHRAGEPNMLQERVLLDIAGRHRKTAAQVALRWAVQRNTVAIPKSTQRAHLEENLNVFDFTLSADEMNAVNGLDRSLRRH